MWRTALFLLLLGPVIGAQDDFEDLFEDDLDELLEGGEIASDGGTTSSLRDWKGHIEIRPRSYFQDTGGPENDGQLLFEAELEMDFRLSEEWTAYFRPRIFLDALDGDLKRFEPFEAHATYSAPGWDLRVGQFVENWGIVDTYNPVDVVNRRDLATDFLDADRLGEFGVRYRRLFDGRGAIGEPTVSVYVLPVWRETLFPGEDQRFSFDRPGIEFREEDGFEPSGSERGFYAARLAATLDSAPVNADVQLVVARGPERTPSVITNAMGDLVPAYYGATTVGLGFRAVPNQDVAGRFLSTLTLKAEVVHKNPHAFHNSPIAEPDDYLAYVIGVDREFYDVFQSQDTLTVTLEYARESGASDPSAVFRPFRDDLILRGLWEPGDFARTSVELRGIYDIDTDETIIEAVFDRQLRSIHEDLKLTVQLQLFDAPGTGQSLFDFFPDNSSVAVGLRWDF